MKYTWLAFTFLLALWATGAARADDALVGKATY